MVATIASFRPRWSLPQAYPDTSLSGQALVYVIGDSIGAGYGTTGGNISPRNGANAVTTLAAFPNVVRVANPGRFSYFSNQSLSGVDVSYASDSTERARAATTLAAKLARNGSSSPIMIIQLGHNGPVGGVGYGASATISALGSAAAYYRGLGWKVVMCTLLPDGATSGFEAFRTTVNAGIRAFVGGTIDAVCDFDTDATMGAFATTSDTDFYQSDKIHPTNDGNILLAAVLSKTLNRMVTPSISPATTYPKWDTAFKHASVATSGSNYVASGGSGFQGSRSQTWRDRGKYYSEIKATTSLDLMVGLVDGCTANDDYIGQVSRGLGAWLNTGMFASGFTAVNAPTITGGSTAGTVIRIAIDFDSGKIWMTRDGTAWPGSGNPESGANPSYTFDANSKIYLAYSGNTASAVATLPSGPNDLAYSIPSGFSAF